MAARPQDESKKMSNKTAEKPIVYIYSRAYHLMSLWSKLGGDKNQEFTCLGRAQLGPSGDVFVTDAWLVKHEGNAGSVEADDDDINELIFDLYEKGIEPQELRVWVHSHPGTGPSATYLSGTDESNISRFMTGEWLISIVFDSKGENPYTRIDFKNPRAKIVADLQVHYFLSAEDQKWATELFEEKASKKVYSSSYPTQSKGGSSTTPAYQSWSSGYQGNRGSQTGGKGSGKGSGKGNGNGHGARAGIDARAGGAWDRNKTKSQRKAEKKAERKAAQNRANRETAALALASSPPQAGQKGSTSESNGGPKAEKKEGDQSRPSNIVPYAWAKNDTQDLGPHGYTGLDEDYPDWDWDVSGGRAAGVHSMTKREVADLALSCVTYLDSIGQRVLENDITIEAGIEEIQELGFTQGDAEDLLEIRTGGSGTTEIEKAQNDEEIEEMEKGPVERMEEHLRTGVLTESLAYGLFDDDNDDYPVPWYSRVAASDKEDDIDAAETREMFLRSEESRTIEEGKQVVIGFENPTPDKEEEDDAVVEAWEQMSAAKREEALERWEEEVTERFEQSDEAEGAREKAEFEAEEEAALLFDNAIMVVLEEMQDELNAWEVEHERQNPYFGHAALSQMAWDSVIEGAWDPVYISFWQRHGHDEAKGRALVKAWRGLTELFNGLAFHERNDEALRAARYWLNSDEGVEYANGKAVEVAEDASSDEFPEAVTPSQLAAEAGQILLDDDEEISREAGRLWICPRRPEGDPPGETWTQKEARREEARTAAKAETASARQQNRYDQHRDPWTVASDIAVARGRTTADVFDLINETPGAIEELEEFGMSPERLQAMIDGPAPDAAEPSTWDSPWGAARKIASHTDRFAADVHMQIRNTPGAIEEAQAGTLSAKRLADLVLEDEARSHQDSLDASEEVATSLSQVKFEEAEIWEVARHLVEDAGRTGADVMKATRQVYNAIVETPDALDLALRGLLDGKRLLALFADKSEAEEKEAEEKEAVDPQEAFAGGRAYSTSTDPEYVAQAIAAKTGHKTDDVFNRMKAIPEAMEEARAGTLDALRLMQLEDAQERRRKLFEENGPQKPESKAVPAAVADVAPTPIPVDDTEKMLTETKPPTIEVIDLTDDATELVAEKG